MSNYKMIISYDGTRYNGWQKQGNTRNTLQGLFEFTLEKLLGEKTEVFGSGRTDAGVHARGQVANFHTSKALDTEAFLIKLNKALPKDTAVHELTRVHDRFHSRLNASAKTYEYRIWNSSVANVFQGRYMFQCDSTLDLQSMKQAAEGMTGTHDFAAFASGKRTKKSTVRTLYNVDITRLEDEIKLTFRGSGFLYNMVRIMAGTLIQVGENKIPPEEIPKMLLSKDRQGAGVTLPPWGLTLAEVEYETGGR